MAAHLELTTAFGPPLDVRTFTIHEEISKPYEIYVTAQSTDPNILLEGLVNQEGTFTINTGNKKLKVRKRTWQGIVQRAEQLRTEQGFKDGVAYSTYALHIVPKLWLLSTNRNQRIFQRMKLPDIVKKVIGEWNVSAKWLLNQTYEKMDYVVQYGESDLVFITRLLERAGIAFYFDHKKGAKDVLTFSDEPHSRMVQEHIVFDDKRAERSAVANVHTVAIHERIAPGKVTVRDFDFRRPDFKLEESSPKADAPEDKYELYRYRPGAGIAVKAQGEATPVADDKGPVRTLDEEVKNIAKRELEAHRARKRTVNFTTNVIDLEPGTVFAISSHPSHYFLKGLLVTHFELSGSPEGEFQSSGAAVFASEPYRPELRQPPPMMQGVQSAKIVGPRGKEIYTDEFGRVRVHFYWDRESGHSDDSSCWIRVNQPWAGRGFGKIVLPRIGHEVLVRYEEGNAERPFVVGRVYNAVNVIPNENSLPTYDTRTSWMSDTSPHRGNSFNLIQFEDALDAEFIYTQAQRDQQKLVKNDETERTGQNRLELVGNSRLSIVASVDARLVGKKFSLQMMSVSNLKILDMAIPDVKPLPTKIEMVEGKILVTSKDSTMMFDGKDISFEAKSSITMKAGGKIIVHGAPNIHINPGGGGGPHKLDGTSVPKADDPIVGTLGAPEKVPAVDPLMAPYEPEPEPPTPPEPVVEEEPECELVMSKITCDHLGKSRVPNMDPASDKHRVLQVVPQGATRVDQANINTWAAGAGPYSTTHMHYQKTTDDDKWTDTSGETIHLESSVSANCGDHTAWTVTGPGPVLPDGPFSGEQPFIGETGKFRLTPWVKNGIFNGFYLGTGDIKGDQDHREGEPERTGRIHDTVKAKADEKLGTGITDNKLVGALDIAVRGLSWSAGATPQRYKVTARACDRSEEWFVEAYPCDRLNAKITLDLTKLFSFTRANEATNSIGGYLNKLIGGRLGGFMPKLHSNITLFGQCEWREHSDWRAYYAYDVSLNGEPLLGAQFSIKIRVVEWLAGPLLAGTLRLLRTWVGDRFDLGSLNFEIAVEIAGTVGLKRAGPDDLSPEKYGNIKGNLTLKIFFEAYVWSRWFASVRAEGRTNFSIEIRPADSSIVEPPRVEVQGIWTGLTIEVSGGVTWFRRNRSWQMFDEKKSDWHDFPIMPERMSRYLGLSA